MFSSQMACALYENRPSCITHLTPTFHSRIKRKEFRVQAVQDGYVVTGSNKSAISDSSSNTKENITDQFKANSLKSTKFPENLLPKMFKFDEASMIQAEESIERVIFNFRFLAFLAVVGSLTGSLLCFLNGCVYVADSFRIYWTNCCNGIHTGKMVLRLVEAIDVYLAGTVMMIFGMGLYGLFIRDVPANIPSEKDGALRNSSFFGMFTLKERPKWMHITSLEELKTKLGHVIVMILLVKMFERSKCVVVTTGVDLLSFSMCIFLSSASLYVLHNMHK